MKTTKPLWMNEPDLDQTSIRFTCPFCYSWIRKEEFEQHIQKQHPQTKIPKTRNKTKSMPEYIDPAPASQGE